MAPCRTQKVAYIRLSSRSWPEGHGVWGATGASRVDWIYLWCNISKEVVPDLKPRMPATYR